MSQAWLVVTSPKNFAIDRKANFPVAGFKERFRQSLSQVQVGDKLVYYVFGQHQFGAICTVTSPVYIDRSRRWSDRDELWPCRLNVVPDLVLPRENMLNASEVIPSLRFITDRQRQTSWGTAFRRGLRRISSQDFHLVLNQMQRLLAEAKGA